MYPEEKNSSVVRSGERSDQQTGPALPIHSMELWIKVVQHEIQCENMVRSASSSWTSTIFGPKSL